MAGSTSSPVDLAITPSSTSPRPLHPAPLCWARRWLRASFRRPSAMAKRRLQSPRRVSRRCWRSRTPEATAPWRTHVSTEADNARPVDAGLEALVTMLRLLGVAADAGQIRHRLGTNKIGAPEMIRCAKGLGLKARAHRTDWSRLARTPLPAIASLSDGGFIVVAKAAEDKVLV